MEEKNRNLAIKSVLFVCSGNTCRSPMAEALLAAKMPHLAVSSAGLTTVPGLPASIGAIDAMDAYGLNLDYHRSRQLSSYLLADADLVLCMGQSHKQTIVSALPELAGKVFTLGEFAGDEQDIADPFGGDAEEYAACAAQIAALVEKAAQRIAEKSKDEQKSKTE